MPATPGASAVILEGKKVAEAIYRGVLLEISLLSSIPKLVVVLVGDDPASQTYVRSKAKKCLDLGLRSETLTLPATVSESELVEHIRGLNRDREVNGILVQLPLPPHISKHRVVEEIDPVKDVKFYNVPIAGSHAVIVGRSEIVGRPMAQLMLMKDATVTLCHSKTRNLEEETSRADILIVAMGRAKFIGANHVKAGAVVIDVGIHRIGDKLCGDVDAEAIASRAAMLTPVPGGVGPMTIAMLMKNLCAAAALQVKLKGAS
jgi:methylenetetrahydrofolate dehydrogenase (NADP+)/methenyltetrahydrofolate cyclohydrolase